MNDVENVKPFIKRPLGILICILACILLLPYALVVCFLSGTGQITETTDPAAYGQITGNYDNETPAAFISSFFPEEIRENFSNVRYSYTAQKGDSYACQVWLEFDMDDEAAFADFISACTDAGQVETFSFDTAYMDYTVSNSFELTHPGYDAPDDIHIEYAKIGKILYREDTRHILFYALCIFDGGYSSTKNFGDFFTCFDIDPLEYEDVSDSR